MKERLALERPDIAAKFVAVFREAQKTCVDFYYANPKHLSFPSAVFIQEEERRLYGAEPWANGVAATRHVVEAFVRYAHEQGYIDRILPVEDLFAPNTLNL
jgi:hypothetical protein